MIQCGPRMAAYAASLRSVVTPGCTVIDIGAGPGLFALLACQFGAGKVIAIDPDPSIGLLHQLARDNGFADRIEVVQGKSTDYRPLAKADVIVSDLRGSLPLYESHIASIKDARDRLLAPGGTLIPSRDQIRIAPVDSAKSYEEFDEPWMNNTFGLDLSAGSRFVVNSESQVDLKEDALLGTPQDIFQLDYRTIVDPNVRNTVALPIDRAGVVHGLLMWFDAELPGGVGYSNAPGQPSSVYQQAFFPLERPVAVEAGDTLHAEMLANLIEGSYLWSWNTSVTRGSAGAPDLLFRQSNFLSNIFQPGQLAKHSDVSVPATNERLAIDVLGLSLIDGERSLRMITDAVIARHPRAFPTFAEGLKHITRLAGRYDGK